MGIDGTRRRQQQKKRCSWWCAVRGGKYEWRAPNRILVVQLGGNANEAKVFKAHAAPLGQCDNLINALKLLANQQKDGDSPMQSIVTGLRERSRNGIMYGLRSFIKEDNHRAVDVGRVRKGMKPIYVRKPKFSEAYPEAAIREGAVELTLRADEVGTLRALSILTTLNLRSEDCRWLTQTTRELRGKSETNCTVTTEI